MRGHNVDAIYHKFIPVTFAIEGLRHLFDVENSKNIQIYSLRRTSFATKQIHKHKQFRTDQVYIVCLKKTIMGNVAQCSVH